MSRLTVAIPLFVFMGCAETPSEDEIGWCVDCEEYDDIDDDDFPDQRRQEEAPSGLGPEEAGEPLELPVRDSEHLDEGLPSSNNEDESGPRGDQWSLGSEGEDASPGNWGGEQICEECELHWGHLDEETIDRPDDPRPVPLDLWMKTSLGAGPVHRPVHGLGAGGGSKISADSSKRRESQ